ncbi:hypothetical protein DP114_04090 [Brasilonema sennae CENA114]|uniref:Uncharacterized protein n=1 Tax=Brasilonema sennae CENA114 TaxID=415709 RepID=A0A856M8V6_9CYAN|nr:hypothetical protein DP114_04090 [Brasilonema sennae CENA114]
MFDEWRSHDCAGFAPSRSAPYAPKGRSDFAPNLRFGEGVSSRNPRSRVRAIATHIARKCLMTHKERPKGALALRIQHKGVNYVQKKDKCFCLQALANFKYTKTKEFIKMKKS